MSERCRYISGLRRARAVRATLRFGCAGLGQSAVDPRTSRPASCPAEISVGGSSSLARRSGTRARQPAPAPCRGALSVDLRVRPPPAGHYPERSSAKIVFYPPALGLLAMASAGLSRRVERVVGYPPLVEMDARQRRELHEAPLDADTPSPRLARGRAPRQADGQRRAARNSGRRFRRRSRGTPELLPAGAARTLGVSTRRSPATSPPPGARQLRGRLA
jgi:hypothetical protein